MIEVNGKGEAQEVTEDNGLGRQPQGEPMDRQPVNAVTQADIEAELEAAAQAPSDPADTVPEV